MKYTICFSLRKMEPYRIALIIIIIISRSLLPSFSNRDILQWLRATQSPSTIVLCCDFNPSLSSLLFFFFDRNTYFIQIAPFPQISLFLNASGSNPECYTAIYSFCLLTLIWSVIIYYCFYFYQKHILF